MALTRWARWLETPTDTSRSRCPPGEAFIRLGLARLMVVELQHGMSAAVVARGAVALLGKALKASGGVIVIAREGAPEAAFNTPAMPFAVAT